MSQGRLLSRFAQALTGTALSLAIASMLCASPTLAQTVPGGQVPLGLNVDASEQAYVDLIQPTASFSALSGTLGADAAGWPTGDFQYFLDNRYTFEWFGNVPNVDPEHVSTDISGTYHLSFTGQATLGGWGMSVSNQVYNTTTNTTTADIAVPNPSGGVVFSLQFTNTRRLPTDTANTGVTNVHLIRPGYTPGTNQVFTNLWLGSLTNYKWSALRFMGATGTNNYAQSGSSEAYPYLLQWPADRTLPNDGPLYQSHPGVHGMPWEQVITTANAANRDIWINVPVNASDGYVTGLANLLKSGLNPGIAVYVEYSNEMWHLGFPQGPWNKQAAQDEVTAGQSNLNYDGIGNADIWRLRRIAKRTIEIGNTFKAVFGDDGARIRPVINNAFIGFDPDILTYVTKNYGPPSRFLYGIAQTGYYSSADKSSVAAVLTGEKAASDADMAGYVQSRAIATFYGLHSLAYEGGEGETGNQTPGPPLWGTADPTLPTLFAASRDPGMAGVETHDLLGNWFPSGGELYMQFSHVGRYSTYGFWGLSEDLNNQATGKWQGMIAALATPAPAVTAGTALSDAPGQSVSVAEAAPPNGNFNVPNDEPWLEQLLRVSAGGTYTLTLQGRQTDSSAPLAVWVDNYQVGTVSLSASADGPSSAVPLTLTPGLHSLFVYGPPSSGPSGVAVQGGDALTLTTTTIVSPTPEAPSLVNPSFETPSLGQGSYRYRPTGGGWTFTASAGITANNSAWLNPNAPDGTQAAFVQGRGIISQAVSGFQAGVHYTLTVQAAQRSRYNPGGSQSVVVTLDGVTLGPIRPIGGLYAAYTIGPFTTTTGNHTLSFRGTKTRGDSSLFLDRVTFAIH